MKLFLSLLAIGCSGLLASAKELATQEREGKVFSLFSIVQFKNEPCTTSEKATDATKFKHGTCYTKSECEDKGGSAKGNCAAGFGVCCLFTADKAGELSQNCTYIQNPGHPSKYSETGALKYTIKKCTEEVCSVRLDFESFNIKGNTATTENAAEHNCPNDKMQASTTAGGTLPVICGTNAGQHIYVKMGPGASDTATLDFSFTGAYTDRGWEIKVTQLPCSHPNSPPDGCFQYHTAPSGRFETFNFPATGSADPTAKGHLANQDYSICIRQNAGYCCVQYKVCSDAPDGEGMSIYKPMGDDGKKANTDTNCPTDYIGIPGSSAVCTTMGDLHNKYCGGNLNAVNEATSVPICDCTSPFVVNIKTNDAGDESDGTAATAGDGSRGTCLEYTQIPC